MIMPPVALPSPPVSLEGVFQHPVPKASAVALDPMAYGVQAKANPKVASPQLRSL